MDESRCGELVTIVWDYVILSERVLLELFVANVEGGNRCLNGCIYQKMNVKCCTL